MKKIIKLVGKYNDLELGYLEDGTYYETGLLQDRAHSWKILEWINQNLEDNFLVRVEMWNEKADMMEESKRKNKEALLKLIEWAFRNMRYWFDGRPFRICYRLNRDGNIDKDSLEIIAEEDKQALKFYALPKPSPKEK